MDKEIKPIYRELMFNWYKGYPKKKDLTYNFTMFLQNYYLAYARKMNRECK